MSFLNSPYHNYILVFQTPEMIVASFKKCGITNTLDNSDNSLVRVEGGEEERDEEHIVVTLEEQKQLNCEIKIDLYTYVINLDGGYRHAVNLGNLGCAYFYNSKNILI